MSELQNISAFSAMLHVRESDKAVEPNAQNASDTIDGLKAARFDAQISHEHKHLEEKLHAVLTQWQHESTEWPPTSESQNWNDWSEQLQERALDLVYTVLHQANISTENRVVIALDASGTLQLKQPQSPALENKLAEAESLRKALLQLTALELADQALQHLEQALNLLQNNTQGNQLIYQACLQGALSHFHLLKQ